MGGGLRAERVSELRSVITAGAAGLRRPQPQLHRLGKRCLLEWWQWGNSGHLGVSQVNNKRTCAS